MKFGRFFCALAVLAALAWAGLPAGARQKKEKKQEQKQKQKQKQEQKEAQAPEQKPAMIGFIYLSAPRPGMAKQLEDAQKQHLAWHREHNDPWAWQTWDVVTGPDTGQYLTLTGGHTWSDINNWETQFATGDEADIEAKMGPSLEQTNGSVWEYLPDVSRAVAPSGEIKLAELLTYRIKIGANAEFAATLKKINEAIQKTNWIPGQSYGWYRLVNGGEGSRWMLVLPHYSWEELAEPPVSFSDMLAQAYGSKQAKSILDSLDSVTVREESEIIVYRPDLSYVPGQK
jgi:hypothetical protein